MVYCYIHTMGAAVTATANLFESHRLLLLLYLKAIRYKYNYIRFSKSLNNTKQFMGEFFFLGVFIEYDWFFFHKH